MNELWPEDAKKSPLSPLLCRIVKYIQERNICAPQSILEWRDGDDVLSAFAAIEQTSIAD
jgi:hypothetical protein